MRKVNLIISTLALLLVGGLFSSACPKKPPAPEAAVMSRAVIRDYLDRRRLEFVEEADGVFAYSSGRDTIYIRWFDERKVLYIVMPRIYDIPYPTGGGVEADRGLALLGALMYVNHVELVGKAEWDVETGDVSFGVTLPCGSGLTYEDFIEYCKYVERRGPEIRRFLIETEGDWEKLTKQADEPVKPEW